MDNLIIYDNDETLQKLLLPMIHILNEKNITKGISIVKENGNLYICFNKKHLSETNQLILEKISFIYSETIFYSDNLQSPNRDRLEYWCPDEYYDKKNHITERCRKKKLTVLQLSLNDNHTILGTSIMLANALQEQDPLTLEANKEKTVFSPETLERHKHYIDSGSPDLKWLCLHISLNNDNPLRNNMYAPYMSICEINSHISCDNIVSSALIGYNEKKYITFNMEKEELEKSIQEYFEKPTEQEKQNITIASNEVKKKLLKP